MSRKQKRRKTRLVELRALSKDPKKEKLRDAFMKKQIDSPEMKAFVEKTTLSLSESLKELMLPDGLQQGEASIKAANRSRLPGPTAAELLVNPTETLLQLQMWTSNLEDGPAAAAAAAGAIPPPPPPPPPRPPSPPPRTTQSAALAATNPAAADISVLPVTPLEANRALAMFVEQGELDDAEETLLLMQNAGIGAQPVAFTHSMAALCRAGKHSDAERVFDAMLRFGIEPDGLAWTALVHAQAGGGEPQRALVTLDRAKRFGLAHPDMYTAVLRALVRSRAHQEAYSLWERMHSELPGAALSLDAFTAMLKMCAQTREVERAFFYIDELRHRGLQPDAATFTTLFRACAGAPHWVSGYQNTIFDAMALMEGCELAPTVEAYNAIIYAFGKAGDAAAAEFYFWEMQHKGLVPTLVSYCSLLDAYAKSSSVGAKAYGTRGRYVRPPRRPQTVDEQAFSELGSRATTELMSRGLWQDGTLERGKRQVGRVEDLADDADDEEALLGQVHYLATEKRNAEGGKGGKGGLRDGGVAKWGGKEGLRGGKKGGMLLRGAAADDGEGEEPTEYESDEAEAAALSELMAELGPEDKMSFEALLNRVQDGGDDRGGEAGEEDAEGLLAALNAAQRREEAELQRLQTRGAGEGGDDREDEDEDDDEVDGAALWATADRSEFSDPFISLRPPRPVSAVRGDEQAEAQARAKADAKAQAQKMLSLLDGLDASASGHAANASTSASLVAASDRSDNSSLASLGLDSLFSEDEAWNLVEFGRAPDPDYSTPLPLRQACCIRRAELCFEHMTSRLVRPDATALTSLLSVYAEALKDVRALQVFDSFASRGLAPDHHAYRALIRMFVRKGDMAAALDVRDKMHKAGVVGDGVLYGFLIEALVHREDLPAALKVLEFCADHEAGAIRVPERHLRMLRARCDKLGVRHPDMPPNPHAWAKEAQRLQAVAARGRTQHNRNVQQAKTWN